MKKPKDGEKKKTRRKRRLRMTVIIVLAHVLGFLSSVHAVMSTRTSQGAIAWVVSLNTFPYVAVPAYWVLGRSKFQGYVSARREVHDSITPLVERVRGDIEPFLVPPEEKGGAGRAAERLAELPFLGGNRVELLIDGEVTFRSILEGIDAAESYVLFQFYIVRDDELGRELKDRLIAARKRGVRVFFLYDEVGSYDLPRQYKDDLREAGAEVFDFHTRQGPGNRFQINFRNHRKVVVVDGRVAWIGGHNVGDEYLGKDPEFGPWRDTHTRIEGPAALAAQLSFAEDWYWASRTMPELNWIPYSPEDADERVLIAPTGPADPMETASLMFIHAISTAQERIWIASPYFVPDEAVISALQLAGLRGVDVRILIPAKPDHKLVYLAAFSYFEEAGLTGAKFYRYDDGFLHQKAMLVDDAAAAIGTANFDNRSFRLNFEITALFTDPGFVAQVETMLEDDFARSTPVADDEYTGKPLWFRLAVRLARLTSPVL